MDENSAQVTGSVQTGAILVDGLGVGDVGNIVLRDRQHLAEDGIMIVVMTWSDSNVVLAGPDIVSREFRICKKSEDLMEHIKEVVENALDSCLDRNITGFFFWGKIKRSKRCTQRFPLEENKEPMIPADHHGSIKNLKLLQTKGADMGDTKTG